MESNEESSMKCHKRKKKAKKIKIIDLDDDFLDEKKSNLDC